MRIALVCDDLVQHGGHEKVVMDVCKIFPKAPLFTTMATKEWRKRCVEEGIELKTSFMQKFPFKKGLNRAYAPLLFYILALENFNFNDYDVVISMSSRFAHGVVTQPKTLHICYMSTVGRMIWEPNTYFRNAKLAKMLLKLPLSHLRLWDKVASSRPDYFLTNSKTSQHRIKKYYGRESEIVYPAIDKTQFEGVGDIEKEDYYLVLTRLAAWKRVDIAVRACRNLGLKLKVAGSGPDKSRLLKLAKGAKEIEFLDYVSDEDKVKYLKRCKALIVTQFEDFGITPLEAMICGTSVIAYAKGGVLETVIDGETGEFFKNQTEKSLEEILRKFNAEKFDQEKSKTQAAKFNIDNFNNQIRIHLDSKLEKFKKD